MYNDARVERPSKNIKKRCVIQKGITMKENTTIYTHIPDISCYYSDAVDTAILAPTAHFEYEMILVTGGRVQAVINHKSYIVRAPAMIFISRLERHNFILDITPYTRYVTTISSDFLLSHLKDPRLISIFLQRPSHFSHVISLDRETYDLVLPQFVRLEEEYRKKKEYFPLRSFSLMTGILIDLYRSCPDHFPAEAANSTSAVVMHAQQYISEHFHRKLTIREVAEKNYVSSHWLSLAFKDMVGIPFKEYLILFRLTEAKKLLMTTGLSVAEIAERTGYVNVNNFVRIFKDREQITPLQYRRQSASPTLPLL